MVNRMNLSLLNTSISVLYMHIFSILLFNCLPSLLFQELVDDLYRFRDCYFETHSMEDAEKKEGEVTQEIEKTLKYLQEKESGSPICTFPPPFRATSASSVRFPHRSASAQSGVPAAEGPVFKRGSRLQRRS